MYRPSINILFMQIWRGKSGLYFGVFLLHHLISCISLFQLWIHGIWQNLVLTPAPQNIEVNKQNIKMN